jgi:hypothetical protein
MKEPYRNQDASILNRRRSEARTSTIKFINQKLYEILYNIISLFYIVASGRAET